jgi:hypothetical protein
MPEPSYTDHEAHKRRIRLAKALFLAAAFASFVLSVALWFSGDRERGLFVGIWVPSICSAGALLLAGASHE